MIRVNLITFVAIILLVFPISSIAQENNNKIITSSKTSSPSKINVLPIKITTQIVTTEDGRYALLKSDGSWNYVPNDISVSNTPIKENSTLSFETGLVSNSGNVVTLARTTFYILDKSLASILMDIVYSDDKGDKITNDINLVYYRFLSAKHYSLPEYSVAMLSVKPHVVQEISTDFSGKATLKQLPVGKYWLMGFSEIRKNGVLWDVEINLSPGDNSLVLDQNNAGEIYLFRTGGT